MAAEDALSILKATGERGAIHQLFYEQISHRLT
jgi:hypothetical protein